MLVLALESCVKKMRPRGFDGVGDNRRRPVVPIVPVAADAWPVN